MADNDRPAPAPGKFFGIYNHTDEGAVQLEEDSAQLLRIAARLKDNGIPPTLDNIRAYLKAAKDARQG